MTEQSTDEQIAELRAERSRVEMLRLIWTMVVALACVLALAALADSLGTTLFASAVGVLVATLGILAIGLRFILKEPS
jgi:hypothetical protein